MGGGGGGGGGKSPSVCMGDQTIPTGQHESIKSLARETNTMTQSPPSSLLTYHSLAESTVLDVTRVTRAPASASTHKEL